MDVNNILQRLSQGPQNIQQQDYDNWNQMVGSAPSEDFGRATYNAIQNTDPNEYTRHVTPGVDGTDPLGQLAPQQRAGLTQSLLGELTRRGVDPNQLPGGLGGALGGLGGVLGGLGGLGGGGQASQYNASPDQLAGLLSWTQQNQPQAFGRVASQYQNQPDVLHSLLGNKALMMAVGAIGTKLISDRMNQGR